MKHAAHSSYGGKLGWLPSLGLWFVLWLVLTGCKAGKDVSQFMQKGETFLTAGELEKAKIEFLNVLRLQSTNTLALTRLAKINFDQGATLQALPLLIRLKDLAPNDLDSRTRLAAAWLGNSEIAQSRQEILYILSRQPTNDTATLLLATSARTSDQVQESMDRLESLRQQVGERASQSVASAHLFLKKQDSARSKEAFDRALTLDPSSAHARIGLAHLLSQQTNSAPVEELLRNASKLAPPRTLEQLALSEYFVNQGKLSQAADALKEVLARTPDYLPAKRLVARVALMEKRYDEAIRLTEDILRIDPIHFDTQLLRAQIFMAQNKPTAAVEVLERVDKSFSPLPAVKHQLALAYLLEKSTPKARHALDQAHLLDPNSLPIAQLKAQLDLRFGEPEKVVLALQPLAKSRPDYAPIHALLGDALMASGRAEDALNVYRGMLSREPNDARLQFAVGFVLRQSGKSPEARIAYQNARKLAPTMSQAVHQLIEMDLDEHQSDRAMAELNALSPEERQTGSSLALEARIHAAQHTWDKAESFLRQAIDKEPQFSGHYYLLTRVYSDSKQEEKAIAELEKWLLSNPNDAKALLLLGMLTSQKNDVARAKEAYEKILSQNPSHVPALNNLAVLHSTQLNQPEKAYEYVQKVRGLVPEDPSVADTLGWILIQRRRYAEALPVLREAVSRLRTSPEVQYHLGVAYSMLAQEGPARAAFQAAVKSGRPFAELADTQRRLVLIDKPIDSLSAAELQEILNVHPDDLIARTRLGEKLEATQRYAEAAKEYQAVIELSPQAFPVIARLARLYSGPLKDRVKASQLVSQARKLSPSDPFIAALAGRMALEVGDFQGAYNFLREAYGSMTNSATLAADFGWAAYSLGREAEATTYLRASIALDPKFAGAAAARGLIAIAPALGDPKALVRLEPKINELLATDPNYVPGLMAQAGIAWGRRDTSGAITLYEKVLTLYPDFTPAQKQLAILYADIPGQESRATTLATKARDWFTADPDLTAALGKISLRKKDYPGALIYFQDAANRRPKDPEFLYYLGLSQFEGRNAVLAKQTLGKALTAGLSGPLAQEARRIVATVQ